MMKTILVIFAFTVWIIGSGTANAQAIWPFDQGYSSQQSNQTGNQTSNESLPTVILAGREPLQVTKPLPMLSLKGYNLSSLKYLMASEYCLTCGHTKNSHVLVEEQHVLKDGKKSSNYCKVNPCDCKEFRI